MREFSERDFPPFLSHYEADHTEIVGVESTLQELAELSISLRHYDKDSDEKRRTLSARFLETYGQRRVFALVDFPNKSVVDSSQIFIEVTDNQDAEAIRRLLETSLGTTVSVETLDPDYTWTTLDLEGFRWFTVDR